MANRTRSKAAARIWPSGAEMILAWLGVHGGVLRGK